MQRIRRGKYSGYNYWREYDREIQRDQYPWRQCYATDAPQRFSRRPSPTYEPYEPKPFPPESRGRSYPSSPPPSPQKPAEAEPPKPEPGYIALAEQPSIRINDPASSRKLLVLDLNGTLLIRAPRSHLPYRGHTSRADSTATADPRLRTVYPRPYIPAFRAYLFAPETRAWLDTMVWSSAQPHSVDDMVSRTFADYAHELVAVWDRKSLGLTQEQYHRKTTTTKDLSKPWKLLPLGLSPAQLEAGTSTPNRDRKVTNIDTDTGTPSSIAHSALTTLLLDDSPHKAALQPYNHVYIPEYDRPRRQRDLASLVVKMSEQRVTEKQKKEKNKHKESERIAVSLTPDLYAPDLSISDGEFVGMTLTGAPRAVEEPFDVTLLTVIGILDEIKHQSNVAAWIRAGGLWGNEIDPGRSEEIPMGNDARTSSDPVTATACEELLSSIWFNDSPIVSYWVARGRKALRELRIEAVHGVGG
ncbi:hypothetical protein V8B97DRAFT_1941792 [Scleroderma yunnanense]